MSFHPPNKKSLQLLNSWNSRESFTTKFFVENFPTMFFVKLHSIQRFLLHFARQAAIKVGHSLWRPKTRAFSQPMSNAGTRDTGTVLLFLFGWMSNVKCWKMLKDIWTRLHLSSLESSRSLLTHAFYTCTVIIVSQKSELSTHQILRRGGDSFVGVKPPHMKKW